MRYFAIAILALTASSILVNAQVSLATAVQIAKAEDSRTYDAKLEALMASPNADVRHRAALAAGRIGDGKAVAALVKLVEKDASDDVRVTAVFALGEIESLDAAAAVVAVLDDLKAPAELRGRAIEAAGKIAAANLPHDDAKQLGLAILSALLFEDTKRSAAYENVVRLGLTALLRVRPPGADDVAKRFLRYSNAAVVTDALNALARLRSREANIEVRQLLKTAADPLVRANAARVLGAAEAKALVPELLAAATEDKDSRVRVSAVRSLTALNDRSAAGPLLARGNILLAGIGAAPYRTPPSQKNELVEITVAVGRLLQGTADPVAIKFFKDFGQRDRLVTPDIFVALARVSPSEMLKTYDYSHCAFKKSQPTCWKYLSGLDQGRAELARLPITDPQRTEALEDLRSAVKAEKELEFAADTNNSRMAIPDRLRSFAAFKTNDAAEIIRPFLTYGDVQVRAAAAGL
ncbi:MAG: HEAT repeat domain-containing protein, partial [Pyrinomonadaceae bacterium]|nr:HEAT repeat domain-containing protein [Pyrinomonadaceae bacterium]